MKQAWKKFTTNTGEQKTSSPESVRDWTGKISFVRMKENFSLCRKMFILVWLLCGIFSSTSFAQDVNIVFPDDAGVVDITKSPYNADNTGSTDVTSIIQQAIDEKGGENRIIYLPNGTYLVSDIIRWQPSDDLNANIHKRTILQGQSKSGTILKLKDNCSGYQSASVPKAMIWTGTRPAQRFRNAIRNMTINTGNGNPGAIGVQFIANNQGTMRHVMIVSGDGNGVYGLDLQFTNENGPAFIYDLTVDGFDYGIYATRHLNSMTMEKIEVRNQKIAGILNANHMLAIYGLTSNNSVKAVDNSGVLTLINASLTGGSSAVPAISNSASLYARNITTSDYSKAINNTSGTGEDVDDSSVDEFVSHPVESLFPSPQASLHLPVEDIPDVPWDPLGEWVNVEDYGAVPGDGIDDAPAFQQAIDAGKTTVYIPKPDSKKGFEILSPVYIRGEVRRIIGCEGSLKNDEKQGTFILEDGTSDVVWFERIDALRSELEFIKNSTRTLVLSSVTDVGLQINAAGKVFLVDYVDNTIHVNDPGAQVWARQLNIEANCATCIGLQNHGAKLWVFGFKTEGKKMDVKVLTDQGGYTEILGCLIYNNSREDHDHAIFKIDNASTTVAGLKYQHFVDPPHEYPYWVEETRGTTTKKLVRDDWKLELFVGYEDEGSATIPSAPSDLSATAISSGQIDLAWTDNSSDEDGFSIERKTGSGGTYAEITTVGAGVTSYSNTGLAASTEYFYRVMAYNSAGNSSYSNEVNATTGSELQSPFGGTAWAIPGTIDAEDFDEGGEGLAYHDDTGGNTGGEYRVTDVDIQTCSEGGFNVGWIATGEWLEYTVNVNSSGNYNIEIHVASSNDGRKLHVEFDGTDKTGQLSVPSTGGWQTWTTISKDNVSLDAGEQIMRIYMDEGGFNLNKLVISASATIPSAPSDLSATAISSGQIDLAWTDNSSDEDGFSIERKTGSGGTYAEITTVGAGVTSYSNTGLATSTTYYYRVRAYNLTGNSSYSNEASATTQSGSTGTAPMFVAAGAVYADTRKISPELPSGIQADDILLLFIETSNQAISIFDTNGGTWTEVAGSPRGTGTAGGTNATRLTVFWSRYNGTQGAPKTTDAGDHQIGRIIAIRGAVTTGDPYDVTAGGVETTSDDSGSIPGATTTVDNTLVVAAIATALPDADGTSNFSSWANSNLTDVTERTDNTKKNGNGGGLAIATGIKTTARTFGNTAVNCVTPSVKGMMSIAIKPETSSTKSLVTKTTNSYQENNAITVYPNPTNGTVNISAISINKVEIFNLSGQLMCNETLRGETSEIVDISGFSNGIYIIKIISGNQVYFKQVVKE